MTLKNLLQLGGKLNDLWIGAPPVLSEAWVLFATGTRTAFLGVDFARFAIAAAAAPAHVALQ